MFEKSSTSYLLNNSIEYLSIRYCQSPSNIVRPYNIKLKLKYFSHGIRDDKKKKNYVLVN